MLNVCEGNVAPQCEEHSAVYSLYIAYLGMLFLSFLSDFLQLFFYGTSWFSGSNGDVCGRDVCCNRTYTQRAGPWHFAVITMMMLYGVNATDAGAFALIVHGIQTLLVVLLGIYGGLHVSLVNRTK